MIEVQKNMKYCVHNIFSTKYLLVLITCMLFVNFFSIAAHAHMINCSEKSRKKNKNSSFYGRRDPNVRRCSQKKYSRKLCL